MKSTLFLYCSPGLSSASPCGEFSVAFDHDLGQVEPVAPEHPRRHHGGPDQQQAGLDDLHPGGALHAADQHVEDHDQTDDGDHDALGEPVGLRDLQQQRDQSARARHLRDQIEQRHDQRGRRGRGADRALAHPERQDVAHREASGVPKQLRDQQQRHQPADQEADRVEEPVVAVQRDGPGDAEERRGGQEVARDGGAVLRAGERVARRVVVRARRVRPADPEDDHERDGDEQREDPDVGRDAADRRRPFPVRARSSAAPSTRVRRRSASGSIDRAAKRT